jgi:hypothetical protein
MFSRTFFLTQLNVPLAAMPTGDQHENGAASFRPNGIMLTRTHGLTRKRQILAQPEAVHDFSNK